MKFIISIFIFVSFFFSPSVVFAQTPQQQKDTVYKAEVLDITAEGETFIDDATEQPYQTVVVQLLDGDDGKKITIEHGKTSTIRASQKVSIGEKVVILQMKTPQGTQYQIIDKYRLDMLYPILFIFCALILFLSRWKGLGALVGLGISILVIMTFIVPQILQGRDPVVISIIGSLFIMATTIYLAHGFSHKTHIALVSTFLSLVLTAVLASLFVAITKLSGLGSDDATSLLVGQTAMINFQGLLLGGIIIGALGVLDDITTSLSAVIEELKKANPSYTFRQLVTSGLRVGSEHISSLVNTLVLAYAGVGLPIFLFLLLNPLGYPLWAILNSELMMEEIVRTLAGSFGLILSVPITTILGAWLLSHQEQTKKRG